MASAQANHDPALSHPSPNGPNSSAAAGSAGNGSGAAGEPPIQLGALDTNQIMSLLRHLPGVFNKVRLFQSI